MDYFPKVLLVDLSKRFGGANTRVLTLMREFPRDRVALATLNNSPVAHEARSAGLTVFPMGGSKFDPRILFRLIRAIRQGDFELLDVQNIQSKFWGSLAAVFTSLPLVSTLNSWYTSEHGKNLKGRIYTFVELWTNTKKVWYIAVAKPIYEALQKAGIPQERISLIYNAVQIDCDQIENNREQFLSKYNLPVDALLCVSVGRLVWAKGYEDLIRVFAVVSEEFPQLYCLIVGDGVLYESLKNQITAAGLEKRIFLLGNLEHKKVLPVVKAADIFLMPSRSEGTPISLLEAAALEKPILATNCGGIPELVDNGVEALLVPPENERGLVDGIRRLVKDADFAHRLAKQAKVRVEREFTLKNQVELTRNVYLQVLQKN